MLLFWSLDRLTREGVLPTLQHLQRLTTYGIGYRSYSEQYFDSCGIFKDAVVAIIATVAKQERIRISERVRAGLTTARNKGQRLGRPKVFVSRARIESLRQEGKSWREIAVVLGTNTAKRDAPRRWKLFKFSSCYHSRTVQPTARVLICAVTAPLERASFRKPDAIE